MISSPYLNLPGAQRLWIGKIPPRRAMRPALRQYRRRVRHERVTMRFDELTDSQRDQVYARFGATPLTGHDLRDYDYTMTHDGNILSRKVAAELARREQAQAAQHTPGPWGLGYSAAIETAHDAMIEAAKEAIK